MAVPEQLTTVGVVGNGLIGHGVAQIFAAAGYPVTMVGRREESLAHARENIAASLAAFRDHDLLTAAEADEALERLTTTTSLEDLAGAEFVVEAVPFDVELEQETFEQLDRICPPPAVLATSCGAPASQVDARVTHKERVIATHFWNPPQLVPLVEVCPTPSTDPEVATWTCDVLRSVGREPVLLEREVDGFIGNRLAFAMWREALALWSEGVASADAIDRAVKASFGRRLPVTGPFEGYDLGGQRTILAFSEFLFPSLTTAAAPPPRYRETVDAADDFPALADWSERDPEAVKQVRVEQLFDCLRRDLGTGP
jgi:3-hydroxybutyryl-CoA dehydrogenase